MADRPHHSDDDTGDDPGLLDETSPLPPAGGETAVPAEGPDDPPNEGDLPRDPD